VIPDGIEAGIRGKYVKVAQSPEGHFTYPIGLAGLEACGIDVHRTARNNGFEVDTRKETYGRWNYFALVLIE